MWYLLKLEYVALFALSLFLFNTLPFGWWVYPLLLLVPDLGMLGYLYNPQVGAWTYNATHFLGTGVLLFIIGFHNNDTLWQLAGAILIGHSGLDRLLGYGLKYSDSFKHTHLGRL